MDGIIQSYNPDFFWPTLIIFLGSLAFYAYKFLSIRRNFEDGNLLNFANPQQRVNENSNRNINSTFYQNGSNLSDISTSTSNVYNNFECDNNIVNTDMTTSVYYEEKQDTKNSEDFPTLNELNAEYIHRSNKNIIDQSKSNLNETSNINLTFQCSSNSKKLSVNVRKDEIFENIITTKLQQELEFSYSTHKVMIIYSGKKIEKEKRVNDIESLKEGSVIHLYVTKKTEEDSAHQGRSNYSNSSSNQNQREDSGNLNSNNVDLQNSVLFSTIKTHIIIFIFYIIFVYQYKQDKEILNKTALILLQVLTLFWACLVSKVAAKLITYRSIIYDNQTDNVPNQNNHYD
jgi:hypothetical protein